MLTVTDCMIRPSGPIGRLLRHRLQRRRAEREDNHGKPERAPGRLRLLRHERGRIPVLLQQRDEHVRRKDRGFRNHCTCPPPPSLFDTPNSLQQHLPTDFLTLSRSCTGRKRTARPTAEQTRYVAGTDGRARRVHGQAFRAAVDHPPEPEILPHARESELQHGAQYGEEDFQLQCGGEWVDGLYGRVAGLYCEVLLSGGQER